MLRRLADRLDLTESVYFRPTVDTAALVEIYASADLLVMPSLFEPFGLVALEALACGCPVLALRPTGACFLQESELADSPSPSRLAAVIVVRPGASRLPVIWILVPILGMPLVTPSRGQVATGPQPRSKILAAWALRVEVVAATVIARSRAAEGMSLFMVAGIRGPK